VSTDLVQTTLELDAPWRLHPQVSIRPERFGALLYHFGTRRLSFVTTPTLLRVVTALDEQPSMREACRVSGISGAETNSYLRALETLAESSMICRRPS
jgi:mycofactocin biosynthesis protein MftB